MIAHGELLSWAMDTGGNRLFILLGLLAVFLDQCHIGFMGTFEQTWVLRAVFLVYETTHVSVADFRQRRRGCLRSEICLSIPRAAMSFPRAAMTFIAPATGSGTATAAVRLHRRLVLVACVEDFKSRSPTYPQKRMTLRNCMFVETRVSWSVVM